MMPTGQTDKDPDTEERHEETSTATPEEEKEEAFFGLCGDNGGSTPVIL